MLTLLRLLKDAALRWSRHKARTVAAAIAYYSLFSLAPLLMLGVALSSMLLERGDARQRILETAAQVLGPGLASALEPMLARAGPPRSGRWATVIGLAMSVMGASRVILQLQDALNTIWGASPRRGLVRRFLYQRLLSFLVVLCAVALLFLSPALSAALSVLGRSQAGSLLGSFAVETLLFAAIFWALPDAPPPGRPLAAGAALTAALFTPAQSLMGLYLARISPASVYGAAGSLVALLVWIYVSAEILLFGAEFAGAYAALLERRADSARARR